MMTSNSTYCLIISAYTFSGRTLHYVCNIITDNLNLEWVQESVGNMITDNLNLEGGNDMLGISIKSIVCYLCLRFAT